MKKVSLVGCLVVIMIMVVFAGSITTKATKGIVEEQTVSINAVVNEVDE